MIRTLVNTGAAALVAAVSLGSALSAQAGECPANQLVPDGQGQQAGATMPKDVTDKVLAQIDLSKEQAGATMPKDVTDKVLAQIDLSKEVVKADDHLFRMRRLDIKPGGIVPWHSHHDRPALIYVVSGEITEYASICKVPILHKAGEVSIDAGRSHWWKNTGKKPVVLISADILHDKMDANM